DGRVLPPGGSPALEKDEQPGVIDANDEIIFLLKDLAGPCPEEQLAAAKGDLTVLRASAANLRAPAFAYLLLAEKSFLPSDTPVAYDASTDTVTTDGYFWGYDSKRPFHYSRMGYADLQGRSKEDLLDRLKVRMRVKALGSMVQLLFKEDEIESRLDGVRWGPVRVVREVWAQIKPVPGLAIPLTIRFAHYPRLWQASVKFRMPQMAALSVSSMDVALIHDFVDLRGIRLSTSGLSQGTVIDGKMIEQERSLDLGPQPWFMISGLGLNQVTVVDLEPGLNLRATALFVEGGAEVADRPEEVPGGLPSVGYGFTGWENLKARTYAFGANIAALPGFPEGGGTGFYRTLRTPIDVQVTTREGAKSPGAAD
ncbi:MAG: hypothetical protein AB1405_07640, partial [Bdellovibrionota bacterium]